jgi:hypothetical protein
MQGAITPTETIEIPLSLPQFETDAFVFLFLLFALKMAQAAY